jgi:hypothetical protein
MNEDTQSGTLWSQSMFDALVVSLRRQQGDDRVKELIADLRRKGYSIDVITSKVVKALGPKAASRVQKLAGGARAPAAPARSSQPYRVSRGRRLKLWMRDAQDSLEDAVDAVRRAMRRS